MSTKEVLFKTEDKDATYLMEYWVDNDYIYFSYTGSSKKGRYWDTLMSSKVRQSQSVAT